MATSKKITDERCVIEFRGVEFEISSKAWKSMKVQKALLDVTQQFWALDKICLGHYDEYIEKMPDENGNVDEEYGASQDTLGAFLVACGEAVSKN